MVDQEHDVTDGMDQLLTAYEKGKLTRRQLLSALVLAGTSMSAAAQQTASPLQGRASMFHHVNIFVSNLPRSAAFYQKLGLPPTLRPIYPAPGGAAYALDFNNGSFSQPDSDHRSRAGGHDRPFQYRHRQLRLPARYRRDKGGRHHTR